MLKAANPFDRHLIKKVCRSLYTSAAFDRSSLTVADSPSRTTCTSTCSFSFSQISLRLICELETLSLLVYLRISVVPSVHFLTFLGGQQLCWSKRLVGYYKVHDDLHDVL